MKPCLFFAPIVWLLSIHVVLAEPVNAPGAVSPSAQKGPATFTQAMLLAALIHDVSAHYALEDPLELELLRPWESPLPVDGSAQGKEVTVSISDYPSALASSMLLRVRYTQNAMVLRDDILSLHAQLWRDALVTKTSVERGASLTVDTLSTRRTDVLRERETLPASLIDQDFIFTQGLREGRVLTMRDVAKRALVRRGSVVEVAAVDGTLQIIVKALAMQDGSLGDMVRVRNIESNRDFMAKVVADNRAQVSF